MDDFSDKSQRFLSWFKSQPGATLHDDIEISDLRHRHAGRGIIAKSDIEAETVLFTIPRVSIICADTFGLPTALPALFKDEQPEEETDDDDSSAAKSPWTALILIMIYEYLRGETSHWKPYLDVLPQTFETPMFWSDAELQALKGTAVLGKIGKQKADDMIREEIIAVIQQHADVFYPAGAERLTEWELFTLAHRMGSTIMAYAFDMEKDEDEERNGENEDDEWQEDRGEKVMMGMVPMADILNADAQYNATINHGETTLTAISTRSIKAGEEILNYYGPLGNGELLRRYGYTTPHHARFDVAELPWTSIVNSISTQLSLTESEVEKIMSSLHDEDEVEDVFVLDRGWDEAEPSGIIPPVGKPFPLPDDLKDQARAFLRAASKRRTDIAAKLSNKRRRDEVYLSAVQAAIKQKRAEYETVGANGEARDGDAMQVDDEGDSDRRQAMATVVREGELAILREALKEVEKMLAELRAAMAAEDGERPAKRARR